MPLLPMKRFWISSERERGGGFCQNSRAISSRDACCDDYYSKDAGKVVAVKKPAAKTDQSKEVSILADAPFDQYLSLSIKVDGRYDDIVTFLGKLETLFGRCRGST
jgi:hypothetical protein